MATLNFDKLESYTYNELKEFMAQLDNELCARDAAEREQAINAFERAYYDLKALGITPYYSEEWDDPVYLKKWDCFYF